MQSTWTNNNYADWAYSKVAVVGIGKGLKAYNTFEQDVVRLLKK